MNAQTSRSRLAARLCATLLSVVALLPPAGEAGTQLISASDITEIAPQGFGDELNSQSWAMIWWKNRLYVGTGRATFCIQAATLALYRPELNPYPPDDVDTECTPDPHDLPLQAEIWRWTPDPADPTAPGTWDRVYQSPNDVPIQNTNPQKFTARDTGYRGMTAFVEKDGTEALYVSGVSSRADDGVGFNGPVPPPQILRSVDGETFTPVPQDPGTFLGDTLVSGFRTLLTYNGKLVVLASIGQLGHGVLFEAEHPEQGNDAFRSIGPFDPVTGEDMTFFEIGTYNGFLWAGTGVQPANDDRPFSLLKTDGTGDPYTFTTVIPDGGFKSVGASAAVISLLEFDDRLYVGTDRELFRVNPDDTWDLVVGNRRTTPDGRLLEPLSGFKTGFDNFFNIHMWRMAVHEGCLIVGTHDQSTRWRNNALVARTSLHKRMGADIFATCDGWRFTMISRDGAGDIYNNGWRNFASTPLGFFLGSANHFNGARIYRAQTGPEVVQTPQKLEVETGLGGVLLSWEGSPTAVKFHVYRDTGFELPAEIGTTDAPTPFAGRFFVDNVRPFRQYHYFVVAEDAAGRLSNPSNMVRSPFEGPVPTFYGLRGLLRSWGAPAGLTQTLGQARLAVRAGDFAAAQSYLETIRQASANPALLPPHHGDDLAILTSKLMRRVALAQGGALPVWRLLR